RRHRRRRDPEAGPVSAPAPSSMPPAKTPPANATGRAGRLRGRPVVLLAIAVAAAVALLALYQTWMVAPGIAGVPAPPGSRQSGASLVPALPALALVCLAGAGGLLAVAGWARRVVAAVVLAAGLGLAGVGAAQFGRSGVAVGWVLLTVAAGLGVIAGSGGALW